MLAFNSWFAVSSLLLLVWHYTLAVRTRKHLPFKVFCKSYLAKIRVQVTLQSHFAEGPYIIPWQCYLEEFPGRVTWQSYLTELTCGVTWLSDLIELPGGFTWRSQSSGRVTWPSLDILQIFKHNCMHNTIRF
jgi:hypothetical protein